MIMKNMSIRKKILISMLAFTLIPILVVAGVALSITYRTMRDQLIYDRRMSSSWLQARVAIANGDAMDKFYQFEVDKDIKEDILTWCAKDGALDYSARWRLISLMNSIISMDSSINSIELFNLADDTVLTAERSGASLDETGDRLAQWEARDDGRQSNLVFFRSGQEILAAHQIVRFEDKQPLALAVIHYRPYQLQRILSEIETENDERILLFNDQDELIEADLGGDWKCDTERVLAIKGELLDSGRTEAYADGRFWFLCPVSGGKMFIVLTVSNQTIMAALRPTVLSCVLVAVLAVAASVVCSVVYSKAVSLPIRRLADRMKSVTINEFSGTLGEEREDEIGILQDSFEYMMARNKELIAQQYESQIAKRNAQLRALQAQINPHFMYNTLQVIGGMSLASGAANVYGMTVALSDIMRYCLNFSKEMVTLREELEYLACYIMIQDERFGGRVRFQRAIDPDTERCLIPKLILQPLMENSFEHGLLDKTGDWEIGVSSAREGDDLVIEVTDNGLGMDPERLAAVRAALDQDAERALQTGAHVGLANVQARARLRYPGPGYGVTIQSRPGQGTRVTLRLGAVTEGEEEGHV